MSVWSDIERGDCTSVACSEPRWIRKARCSGVIDRAVNLNWHTLWSGHRLQNRCSEALTEAATPRKIRLKFIRRKGWNRSSGPNGPSRKVTGSTAIGMWRTPCWHLRLEMGSFSIPYFNSDYYRASSALNVSWLSVNPRSAGSINFPFTRIFSIGQKQRQISTWNL